MSGENGEVGVPVRRLWAALSKRDWDAFSAELDPEMEYTRRGAGRLSRPRGKSRSTSVATGLTSYGAGRLYRISEYRDSAKALEAAGLSE